MVDQRRKGWSKFFAIVTPLAFLCVIALMVLSKFGIGRDLKGGEAAALVGGAAAVLMILASFAADGPRKALDASADHVTEGFVFAFRAMGSVLPIAGFFFLGAGGDLAASILNVPVAQTPSLLFELIQSAQGWIPDNHVLVAFGVLIVGMITGKTAPSDLVDGRSDPPCRDPRASLADSLREWVRSVHFALGCRRQE